MHYKGIPQFLRIIIDIFGEPKHYYHPYFVRLYFYISMLHISPIERLKESITRIICKLSVLHISINLRIVILLPDISRLHFVHLAASTATGWGWFYSLSRHSRTITLSEEADFFISKRAPPILYQGTTYQQNFYYLIK